MKHKISITILLLAMFLITQFIGLAVLNAYAPITKVVYNETTGEDEIIIDKPEIPFGLENEKQENEVFSFVSLIFALILAFFLIMILMKYNLKIVFKIWFGLVIVLSIGLALYPLFSNYINHASYFVLIVAIPLAYFKIIKPNFYVHNLTELIIYPGISVVIVSLIYNPFNITASLIFILLLLVLISLYDAWAVWKSGIMQKMARYQMEELRIFGGFLIPSMDKKEKQRIKKLKEKYKKVPEKLKQQKIKVNLAILGGGDVVFPIICAGIFMWAFPEQALFGIRGLVPGLFIIFGALAGLVYLFIKTEKGKAYPAMPYITAGIFAGLLLWKILI